MTLINGQRYTLPDGTPVVIRQDAMDPRFWLAGIDGATLYLQDVRGGWRRVLWVMESRAYQAVLTDLTDDDLRPIKAA